MRTTIKIWFLMVILLAPVLLTAQNQRPAFRERLLNARFNEISTRMQLDAAKAEKLKPIYFRYEKEKASVFIVDEERISKKDRKSVAGTGGKIVHQPVGKGEKTD
jgi:hypothetical protein